VEVKMPREVHGIFEKVGYSNDSSILLYVNHEYENYSVHWHAAMEIIMPLENSYSVTMSKVNYSLNVGDIIIIPPGELHELKAPPTGSRIIFLFDFTLISNLKGFSSILPVIAQPRLITKDNSPEIYDREAGLLLKIKDEYRLSNTLYEACVYSLIIQMFVLIGRNHIDSGGLFPDVRANKQKEYIEKFNKIFDYIDKNYTEDISLDTVADVAGFSKFHFSRLFKQFTDTSFYDYLNLRRIKSAENLLLDPSLPITEVALQSGFSSISTFNRVFKAFKKCTPSEFKELYMVRNKGTPAV
jgi:AraC-like DNA-binding protein